jgi:hypothetical protein
VAAVAYIYTLSLANTAAIDAKHTNSTNETMADTTNGLQQPESSPSGVAEQQVATADNLSSTNPVSLATTPAVEGNPR